MLFYEKINRPPFQYSPIVPYALSSHIHIENSTAISNIFEYDLDFQREIYKWYLFNSKFFVQSSESGRVAKFFIDSILFFTKNSYQYFCPKFLTENDMLVLLHTVCCSNELLSFYALNFFNEWYLYYYFQFLI